MIACCTPCNNVLEHRFETPARETVLRLLDGHEVPSGAAADRAREWLLKTWLLLAHPRAEYKDPLMRSTVRLWPDLPEVFTWMINAEPPPVGLSAWAFRFCTPHRDAGQPEVVGLREGIGEGGLLVDHEVFELTIETLSVAVVYHPGRALAPAAEVHGDIVRLWPAHPASAIPSLPAHHWRPVVWGLVR